MSRLIRWKGLIGFVVVMATIFVLFYLFAETLIKKGIEQSAGYSLGAEVNVASVTLQYSPLVLTINDFQATDADNPNYNVFSFESASAGIDVWQYLLGKVIIEELSIEQLTFMDKRASIGEVYQDQSIKEGATELADSVLPTLDLSLPDIDTLLNNSNLQTVKSAEKLQKSYQQERKKLLALKEKLPTKEKLKVYQAQVKALGKSKVKSLADIEKIKKDFEQIKKQFKQDQQIVKQAKKQLSLTKNLLAKQVAVLKAAPNKDWQFIEKEYQLDKVNTEDFAHILFGEQAREYYRTAETIYNKLQPLLANNEASKKAEEKKAQLFGVKGRFVHFDEAEPLPAFLVKQATISMVLAQGDFTIKGEELTHQHWLRGKESKLTFTSANLMGVGLFNADFAFKLAKNSDANGQGNWSVKQLALKETPLRKTNNMEIVLESGTLAGQGTFSFISNSASDDINSVNYFSLSNARYQGSSSSKFGKVVVDTIKSLKDLTLEVSAIGAIASPDLSISSSLDNVLKNAFSQQVDQKLTEFKGKVNSGLNKKLSEALKINDQKDGEMLNFEALLTDTDKALSQLENSDIVKQQKKKLKNKVEDKLMKKLGSFLGG